MSEDYLVAFTPISSGRRPINRRAGDHDQRRSQQAIVEQVALLEHLHARCRAPRRPLATWLMAWCWSGSKASPIGSITLRPLSPATLSSCLQGQLEAVAQRVGVGAGGSQAGVQAVEHRQQLATAGVRWRTCAPCRRRAPGACAGCRVRRARAALRPCSCDHRRRAAGSELRRQQGSSHRSFPGSSLPQSSVADAGLFACALGFHGCRPDPRSAAAAYGDGGSGFKACARAGRRWPAPSESPGRRPCGSARSRRARPAPGRRRP